LEASSGTGTSAQTGRSPDGHKHAGNGRSRLIRTLRLELQGIKVLGLSMHADKDLLMALRRVGVAGLLTKDDPLDNLVAAIRTCVAGLKHC